MNLKRLFAGVLACCVVGGALPSVGGFADNTVITAYAADDEEYTEGTYESLTYRNYGDYIIIWCHDNLVTSVEIPAEIEGVPVTKIAGTAFRYCFNLMEITIPNSVTYIAHDAFFVVQV